MQHDPNAAPPPEQMLMQLLMGKFLAMSTTVVANLGVADHMKDGPTAVADLAKKVGANEDALYRVMRALAVPHFFEEHPGRKFSLTPSSNLLRSDLPNSMRAMATWICEPKAWEAWTYLEHSVRTGEPGLVKMGVDKSDTFGFFKRNPTTLAIFQNAMTAFSAMTAKATTEAYDFKGMGKLCDIGGGHGHLLCTIVEATPGLKGAVYDLPEVIEGTKKLVAERKLTDRVECVAGNFFDGVPPADSYIMRAIIHDWDDARAAKILENCRKGLTGKNGKVLVCDHVITDRPESASGKLIDLEMLVMTPGGRERTENEWNALFAKAGLKVARIVQTKSPIAIIEGVPA